MGVVKMINKRLMPPQWLAYPSIPRGSIGWRMGYGESYSYAFSDWFMTLSENEKAEYIKMFPEPKRWACYWDRYRGKGFSLEDIKTKSYSYNDCITYFWQEDGKPLYNVEWLKKQHNNGNKIEYTFFWGHRPSANGITKSCLSQWWKSDFSEGIYNYCCMEQYMMSQKALLFGDKEIFEQIMACDDPKTIKSFGRKIHNFDEKIWDKAKYSIVLNGNYLKFTQNRKLMTFLLSTGDKILVEASPYDRIWGIHMSADDKRAKNPNEWQGENLLGFALTEVREEIKRVYANEHLLDYSFVK